MLVTAVVVLHDDGAGARKVTPRASRRQVGQRRAGAVGGDLDELQAAEVVGAGQHSSLRVDVEADPHPDVEEILDKALEIVGVGHGPNLQRGSRPPLGPGESSATANLGSRRGTGRGRRGAL